MQVGVAGADIGVITPYRHQVSLVRDQLRSEGHLEVEVNTVDQYQGRDKSVIIMSFVRNNKPSQLSVSRFHILLFIFILLSLYTISLSSKNSNNVGSMCSMSGQCAWLTSHVKRSVCAGESVNTEFLPHENKSYRSPATWNSFPTSIKNCLSYIVSSAI